MLRASAVALLACGAIVGACSHDWDFYDPGAALPGSSSAGSTASASSSSTATNATSNSTSTGGPDVGTGGSGGSGSSSSGGVVAGIACGSDKLVPLRDNFTKSLDPKVWDALRDPMYNVSIDGSAGDVSLTIPLGPITWGGVIVSRDRFDMRSCAVFAEAKAVPVDGSLYMNLVVKLDPDKNFVEFTYQEGKLQGKYTLGGIPTVVGTCDAPYDAKKHRYWRIRVDSGVTYWEASADAKTWPELCHKQFAFPYENVVVGFGAGTWIVTMPTDGGAINNKVSFDNFNAVAP